MAVMAAAACPPPSTDPLLAVLGVTTIDTHVKLRKAVRSTWLHDGEADRILARFVLLRQGALDATLRECAAHGDCIFLEGPASMPAWAGMLLKLLRWLRCAAVAWPRARLVGKVDDDSWASLPGIAAHVRFSLAHARLHRRQPTTLSAKLASANASSHSHIFVILIYLFCDLLRYTTAH